MRQEIELKLSQIQPSDLPREESWGYQEYLIGKMRLRPPIDLRLVRVTLSTTDDGVIFPKNGNHRLGVLTMKFGIETLVRGVVEPAAFTESGWDLQIERMRRQGVHNFQDWLDKVGNHDEW